MKIGWNRLIKNAIANAASAATGWGLKKAFHKNNNVTKQPKISSPPALNFNKLINNIPASSKTFRNDTLINNNSLRQASNVERNSSNDYKGITSLNVKQNEFNSSSPINSRNGLNVEKNGNDLNSSIPVNSRNGLNVEQNVNNLNSSIPVNSRNGLNVEQNELNSSTPVNSRNGLNVEQNELNSSTPVNSRNGLNVEKNEFNSSSPVNSKNGLNVEQNRNDLNSSTLVNSRNSLNDEETKRDLNQILKKNEDGVDFDEIIEVENELKTSINNSKLIVENTENSKVIKSLLIDNQLISTGDISNIKPGDFVGLKIEKGSKEDLLYISLMDNKNINSKSYSILSEYAKENDLKIQDVIKKYKKMNDQELSNFILKIAGHTTSNTINSQQTIEKVERNTEILNSKSNGLNNSQAKLNDSDLEGLF